MTTGRRSDPEAAPPEAPPLDERLAELRDEIDGIDDALVALLDRRAQAAQAVGEAKRDAGAHFYVPARERAIFERLLKKNETFPDEGVRAVFREIIAASLALEQPLTVAFLGPEGTFSHQAAKEHFGLGARLRPSPTFHDVFDEVERGRAAYAVVPIENTTEGVVGETMDRFRTTPLTIVAETVIEISHQLLSRSGQITDIQKVFSHPQPAGQCRDWLRDHLRGVPVVEVASTAMAARLAAEDPTSAAIASEVAARIYDLRVVRGRIEDQAWNYTRFLVVGREPVESTGCDKTSLMLTADHRPGGLFSLLEPLAQAGINLSKIESRPERERPFEYSFYVDIEGHRDEPAVAAALAALEERSAFFKVLGSYPRARPPALPKDAAQ